MRVDEALQRPLPQRAESSDKKDLERQIAQAAKEQEHIKEAMRRGLIGDITREMLEEVEVRIRELRAKLETPAFDEIPAFNLRGVVESKLKDLASLLGHDVERPRALLRELLGDYPESWLSNPWRSRRLGRVRVPKAGAVEHLYGSVPGGPGATPRLLILTRK